MGKSDLPDWLNNSRKERIIAWCSFNGWRELRLEGDDWKAIPPGETEHMLVPSIAWKPPFPGNLPQGE